MLRAVVANDHLKRNRNQGTDVPRSPGNWRAVRRQSPDTVFAFPVYEHLNRRNRILSRFRCTMFLRYDAIQCEGAAFVAAAAESLDVQQREGAGEQRSTVRLNRQLVSRDAAIDQSTGHGFANVGGDWRIQDHFRERAADRRTSLRQHPSQSTDLVAVPINPP